MTDSWRVLDHQAFVVIGVSGMTAGSCRLKEIGCYRGRRHYSSLPVRGQNTKNNARTRKGKKVHCLLRILVYKSRCGVLMRNHRFSDVTALFALQKMAIAGKK